MRSVLDAGFIFWGLFLVFGLIVVAYLAWMFWVEGIGPASAPKEPPSNEESLAASEPDKRTL